MTLPNALTQTQNDVEFPRTKTYTPRCHCSPGQTRCGWCEPIQLVKVVGNVNEGDGR